MKHATYIGPDHQLVAKGMGALLRDHPMDTALVLAQFDARAVDGKVNPHAYGWHEFPRADFQYDKEPAQ